MMLITIFKLFLFTALIQPYAHGSDIDEVNRLHQLTLETFKNLQELIVQTQKTINNDVNIDSENYHEFNSLFGKIEKQEEPMLHSWMISNLSLMELLKTKQDILL